MLKLKSRYFSLVIKKVSIGEDHGHHSWNYDVKGPRFWPQEYPLCSGALQSPINIITSQAIYDMNLGDITFNNYNVVLYWNATNNGHTSEK